MVVILPRGTSREASSKKSTKNQLFAHISHVQIPELLEKPSKLNDYDRKGYPDEHVKHVNDRPNYYHANEETK